MKEFTSQQIETCERIAQLFARHIRRTITQQEREELQEWVGANPTIRIPVFKELTNRRKIKKAMKILNS